MSKAIKKLDNGNVDFYIGGRIIATINGERQMVVVVKPLSDETKDWIRGQAKLHNAKCIIYNKFLHNPLTVTLVGDTVPVLECNGTKLGVIVENVWCPEPIAGLPENLVGSALDRAEWYIGFIKNKPDMVDGESPIYAFENDIKVSLITRIKNAIRKVFKHEN